MIDRRTLLRGGAALLAFPRSAPAVITREALRPKMEQGVASGDVSASAAVIWSRADRDARMVVEWATKADFSDATRREGPFARQENDFTAKMALRHLPDDTDIFYRVIFDSLRHPGATSAPISGRFRTPPLDGNRAITFAWSGDVCGQGYGINPDIGGMRIFEAMGRHDPDLFIHCGDTIYADKGIRPTRNAGGGRVWRSLTTPEKSKVAETLREFHGHFRYNLLDDNLRQFSAHVPSVVQWDDHETKNNWWPGRVLTEDNRYREKRCNVLSARARQAFFDYMPIAADPLRPSRIYRRLDLGPLLEVFVLDARSYRGPNSFNHQAHAGPATRFFGVEQLQWLLDSVRRSRARWKLVACDQPLALLIGHAGNRFEGLANGHGRPVGRELELAWLLPRLKELKQRNVVWVTADVHYAAAHHFSPKRASFRDFNPFWEFVAGPLNAGTFGPNAVDHTFGARAEFVSVPRDQKPGASPLDGRQYYGIGKVQPNGRMTITLHDLTGAKLWGVELDAS